ncbi:MAG TPA: DUF2950 domain-containing protein [Candidatus Binatia bacterium]|jgi:hypothetical protein
MKLLKTRASRRESIGALAAICAALLLTAFSAAIAAAPQQKTFSSAEEAVKATIAAAKAGNDKELLAIFGPQSKDLLSSGDPVADKERRGRVIAAYEEKNRLAKEGNNTILIVGNNEWPFPIPLVQEGGKWKFDTEQGREEILNRRIGENELFTINTLLAVVDAERDYAMKADGKTGLREYAQKFLSDAGKKNGLYWDTKAGEPESPLGPIMKQARNEGYKSGAPSYHGYHYRILTAQGKDAPGGAYSYIVKGKMVGGFAVVAYPAEYGNSGVMTFIVNHDGKVLQKDLGKNTSTAAAAIKDFNPDKGWTEAKINTASK